MVLSSVYRYRYGLQVRDPRMARMGRVRIKTFPGRLMADRDERVRSTGPGSVSQIEIRPDDIHMSIVGRDGHIIANDEINDEPVVVRYFGRFEYYLHPLVLPILNFDQMTITTIYLSPVHRSGPYPERIPVALACRRGQFSGTNRCCCNAIVWDIRPSLQNECMPSTICSTSF